MEIITGQMDGEKIVRAETSFDRIDKMLHDVVREDVHFCEVCERKTSYYVIEVDDGDCFWYCKEHAKSIPDGDFINDNINDR